MKSDLSLSGTGASANIAGGESGRMRGGDGEWSGATIRGVGGRTCAVRAPGRSTSCRACRLSSTRVRLSARAGSSGCATNQVASQRLGGSLTEIFRRLPVGFDTAAPEAPGGDVPAMIRAQHPRPPSTVPRALGCSTTRRARAPRRPSIASSRSIGARARGVRSSTAASVVIGVGRPSLSSIGRGDRRDGVPRRLPAPARARRTTSACTSTCVTSL